MRTAITPVLALTALVAAAVAPRVYAAIGSTPATPVEPVMPVEPIAPTPPATDLSDAQGATVDVKLDRSAVLAGGTLRAELEDYRLRNAALNEVVGSAAVVDNLAEVEQLQEQIQTGAIDRQGVVDMATSSYQKRRSGQAYAY